VEDWDAYFSGGQSAAPQAKPDETDWDAYFGGSQSDASGNIPLSAVPGMAWENAPESAKNTIGAFGRNPVQAAADLGHMGVSAVADALKERYGGWENIKRTAATDPVGMGADAALVAAPLTGGKGTVGAVARLPFNVASKAALAPVTAARKVLKYNAGEMSGLGPTNLSEAFSSGKAGGSAGRSYREHYTGRADPDEPVDLARGGVDQLRKERGASYIANMAATKTADATDSAGNMRITFDPIDEAWNSIKGSGSFRGKSKHPQTVKIEKEIDDVLTEWRADPGAHTAQGFDALKQRINHVAEQYPYNTNERRVAGRLAGSIKQEIVKQEPSYAHAMKAYEKASSALNELEKSMSLGKKSSYDSALRKLQSVFRNNAYTNYSARAKLAELISKRAPDLMPMLAGQAANTWMPRGLPGKLLSGGAGMGAAAAAISNPAVLATLVPLAAMASPKAAAGIAHGAGMVSGAVSRAIPQEARAVARTAVLANARIPDPMKFAEEKLTPDVMAKLKSSPAVRPQLSKWAQAVKNGKGVEEAAISLADAIANEAKRPDLADRIAQELIPQ
jgi:hypothetical protein